MADTPYADVRGRLRTSSGDFAAATDGLRGQWQDAAAATVSPHLTAVADGLAELGSAVEQQEEAHARVDQLAELVGGHAEAVDRLVGQVQAALEDVDRSLAEASAAAAQVRSAASASSARVAEALRLAGQAGAACGQASGFGALEGLVQQGVVGERKRAVLVMAGKALAVEGVWWLGQELAQKATRIPQGAVPANWGDQVREQLEMHVPVLATHVSAFVVGMRDRWSR